MNTIFTSPIQMPSVMSAPKIKEKLDEKFIFMETASTAKMVDNEAAANGETRSDVLRRALENYYAPHSATSEPADNPRTFTAPYIGAIPCGPWNPTEPGHERFTVSTEVADELEARDGDWWFRAAGDSMIGAGILDGSLVLVRPYDGKPPRRGDVVAVQIADEAGEVVGTFKRFDGQNGDVPKLLDGNDDVFDLPDGARVAAVLARGVGVVSRL